MGSYGLAWELVGTQRIGQSLAGWTPAEKLQGSLGSLWAPLGSYGAKKDLPKLSRVGAGQKVAKFHWVPVGSLGTQIIYQSLVGWAPDEKSQGSLRCLWAPLGAWVPEKDLPKLSRVGAGQKLARFPWVPMVSLGSLWGPKGFAKAW